MALRRRWVELRSTETGSFLNKVGILGGGAAAEQAFSILAYPLLTRLYRPADLGIASVFSSLLAFVMVASALRYEFAIPLPADKDRAANLVALSLIVVLGMSTISALLVLLLRRTLADLVGSPELGIYLWLLPFAVLAGGAYRVLTYWAIRHKDYGRIARTRFAQGSVQAACQILFGGIQAGPLGLIGGDALGQTAGTLSLGSPLLKRPVGRLGKISAKGIKEAASRYKRFPMFSAGSALINTGGLQLPFVLFAGLYGPRLAGWLVLGQRFIGLPAYLIGQAVSQIYLAEASHLADRPGDLRRMFIKTGRRMGVMGLVPIVLLMAVGPWAFSLLFGPQWREGGVYVQILGLMILVQFVVVPLSQTLNLLERQHWQLFWDVGRLILVAGSIVGAFYLGWSGRRAVAVYGLSMLTCYIVLYALAYIATGKEADAPR